MTQFLAVALIVTMGGFAGALQGQFMGLMGKNIGKMESEKGSDLLLTLVLLRVSSSGS